ncbi:MAG TPA: aminoglycoside phosphotransferase family protein [Nocardioidaceae bacterium]|nr:aminoglycoside phosphotransferase family protein [Nocardioidaceae bacterium]
MPIGDPTADPDPDSGTDGRPGADAEAGAAAAIRTWAWQDFDLDLVDLIPVDHGADPSTRVWRATSSAGHHYAVKLSTARTTTGPRVTRLLAESGVTGVLPELRSRRGHPWADRSGDATPAGRLSVAPWAPGRRALEGGLTRGHWQAYGRLLAQVHRTGGQGALPTEDHDHAAAAAQVRELARRFDRAADSASDESGSTPTPDPVGTALARDWRDASAEIEAVVARADRLGAQLRDRDHADHTPRVLCHGDPHLGNVLVDEPDRLWLIDWDDAVLAPPERDLMFVVGGVLAFAPVDAVQSAWFFEGYGDVVVDPRRLAYYRCARALVDLVDPTLTALTPASPMAERQQALDIVRGILSPTGLVTLSLS